MTRTKKLLIAIAAAPLVLVSGALAFAATRPAEWRVERARVIAGAPERVFPAIARLSRWPEWATCTRPDGQTVPLAFSGPAEGVGAAMAWTTPEPAGTLTVTRCVPGRELAFEIRFEGWAEPLRGRIGLEPVAGGTRVTWVDQGVFPSLPWRALAPLVDGAVGGMMEESLANLDALAR